MTKRQAAFCCILLLLCVVLLGFGQLPTRWQYTVISAHDGSLADTLEKAGQDGWEVISARRALEDPQSISPRPLYEFIAKRPAGKTLF